MGVLQVIETSAGRAISANGVVWDIEVMALPDAATPASKGQQPYYRYGLWSESDGLVNRPLAPHLQNDPLKQYSDELIQLIQQNKNRLPFKLIDTTELWLFDASAQLPLVLLAAIDARQARPTPEPRHWSACLGAEGVPSQRRFPQVKALQEQVMERAGFNQHRVWIQRKQDGSGECMSTGKVYSADMFPPFLIAEEWPEAEQVQRAEDYIHWIAPSLLTLQHLSTEQRALLEQKLYIQAVSVDHHWHLYPAVLDEALLKSARVQCQLQQSQQT